MEKDQNISGILLAQAQEALHDVLRLAGSSSFIEEHFTIHPLTFTIEGRMAKLGMYDPLFVFVKISLPDKTVVFSCGAAKCSDTHIGFPHVRYTTQNVYGYKVCSVKTYRGGVWETQLPRMIRPESVEPPDLNFTDVDDAEYWA